MSCRNKRSYYVVSEDLSMCYGYNNMGQLTLIPNLPWKKPYIFVRVSKARKIAEKVGYGVRYYPGKRKLNHHLDNCNE